MYSLDLFPDASDVIVHCFHGLIKLDEVLMHRVEGVLDKDYKEVELSE